MTTADIRALNREMADRIQQKQADPYAERHLVLRVLETRGRRSGARYRTPVGVVQVDGRLYLVSPVGDRDWPRNLQAQPECALCAGGNREPRLAVEVNDIAPVVRAYLAATNAPWVSRAFPVSSTAADEEIQAHAARIAVFRLDQPDTKG